LNGEQADAWVSRAVSRSNPREYLIRRKDQLHALTSPERRRVLEGLEALGRATVKQLAEHLGRLPESLYYHVRKLGEVDLVVEAERRGSGRRTEVVYAADGGAVEVPKSETLDEVDPKALEALRALGYVGDD